MQNTLAEVLVDGENFSVIRKRETYEDLTALEKIIGQYLVFKKPEF